MQNYVDIQGGTFLIGNTSLTPKGTLVLGLTMIDQTFSLQLLGRTGNPGSPVTPVAIPAGYSQLIFAGQDTNELGATSLFNCTSFAAVGSGSTLNYVGTLSLNLSALLTLMAEQHTLNCYVDVWIQNEDASAKLPLILSANCVVYFSMWQGNEADPTGPDPSYPAKQFLPLCMPSITGLTGGGSSKLDGIPTAGGTAPQVVILFVAGAARFWERVAGTATAGPGIVLPTDYNASTNAQYWRSML